VARGVLPQSHFIAFTDIRSKHSSNALRDSSAVVFNLGSFAFLLRVARASDKNSHTSIFHISYMEPLFVVGKIIGSPEK